MNNYRVFEHHGKFWVQVETTETETIGLLWWKKIITTKHWVNCTYTGGAPRYYFSVGYFPSPMHHFKTLKAALKQIDIFLKPDKVYDIKKPNLNWSFQQMANGDPEKIANIIITH